MNTDEMSIEESKDLGKSNKRKVAIIIGFIVGILELISKIIGIVYVFTQAMQIGAISMMPYILLTRVFSFVPLIAAFISRKNLRVAGVIFLIIAVYNIIMTFIVMSNGASSSAMVIIISLLIPIGMIIAGALCFKAK